jgi:hypothetical protein
MVLPVPGPPPTRASRTAPGCEVVERHRHVSAPEDHSRRGKGPYPRVPKVPYVGAVYFGDIAGTLVLHPGGLRPLS